MGANNNPLGATGAELKDRLNLQSKFLIAVRSLVGIVLTICLLTVYSILNVDPSSAEFFVCAFTLGIAGMLLIAAFYVSMRLKRAVARDATLLAERAKSDESRPWKV